MYTQEQINNRINNYVCWDCGYKFLTEKQKESRGNAVTFHESTCALCHELKGVCHIRIWNYLKLNQRKETN